MAHVSLMEIISQIGFEVAKLLLASICSYWCWFFISVSLFIATLNLL